MSYTAVLDASIGKPAKNVQVSVQKGNSENGESYAFHSLANGFVLSANYSYPHLRICIMQEHR